LSQYFFRNNFKERKESTSSKEEISGKSLIEKRRILSRSKSTYDTSPTLIFQNKNINEKLDKLEQKINMIIKENKEIKQILEEKDINISKKSTICQSFTKEKSHLKYTSNKFHKLNKENTLYRDHSLGVNSNLKQKALTPEKCKFKTRNFSKFGNSKDYSINPIVQTHKEDSLLGINKNLFQDTLDQLVRACPLDAKNIIHLPKKVDIKSDSKDRNKYSFDIPKLEIV